MSDIDMWNLHSQEESQPGGEFLRINRREWTVGGSMGGRISFIHATCRELI